MATPAPKLLDRVRARIRTLHYSIRTEEACVDWARRFILFHCKRHPLEMGAPEISAFLTHLAVERNVSARTQNQAKAALLFLYKEVLELELPWLDEVVSAKTSRCLPVVSTQCETRGLLAAPKGLGRRLWRGLVARRAGGEVPRNGKKLGLAVCVSGGATRR